MGAPVGPEAGAEHWEALSGMYTDGKAYTCSCEIEWCSDREHTMAVLQIMKHRIHY